MKSWWSKMFPISAVIPLAALVSLSEGYFADWSALARDRQPTCVDIPDNMTLCKDIGYKQMRLPNLLEHDTLHEVSQQSVSWIPLLNIKCHPDTKLFLCSLFSPVCLESPIYPCRSLCQAVRGGCERKMLSYGFPWPAMLECNNLEPDNDMCIMAQHDTAQQTTQVATQDSSSACAQTVCDQHVTAENILDNFCRADFVVRVRARKTRGRLLRGRKAKVFRAWKGTRAEMRALRNPRFLFQANETCCADEIKDSRAKRYLVMGMKPDSSRYLVPTFIIPWSKSKEIKRARRMFRQMNCDNLKETSQKMIVDTFAPQAAGAGDTRKRRAGRRTRTRRDRKRKPASIWDGIRS